MTRVIVAGPYPTMPGPESAATFSLVRSLVAAGEDVTVISPLASAAHFYADHAGIRGAIRLARLAMGADRLHLRIDVANMDAHLESPRQLAIRLPLHALLRRVPESHLRLDRVPEVVSRQFASLVLAPASRVLVSTAQEREALVRAGVDGDKIEVAPEPEMMAAAAAPPIWRRGAIEVPAGATAADLQQLVRRRAEEDRIARKRAMATAEGAASLPLRHLVRMERVPVRSRVPGGSLVKKAIAKALQWQFDNVIASVNRLHQATIDAIENLEERQSSEDTAR